MLTFLNSQQRAQHHNEAYERGEASFQMDAWNHLSDLPLAAYKKRNGY